MARLEIKRPFRTVPESSQDFEKFFRDAIGLVGESIQSNDIGSDSVTTTKVANKAITLQKLADLTADTLVGRLGTDGEAQQLTGAQVIVLLQALAWVFANTVQFTNAVRLDGTVGFFGETPVGQQTDPGAPTIAAVSGSGADTDINDNFSALEDAVNGIRLALNNLNLTT